MQKSTENLLLYGDAGIAAMFDAADIITAIIHERTSRSELLNILENLGTGTLYKLDGEMVEWDKGAVLKLWKRALILEQFVHQAFVYGWKPGDVSIAEVWGERGECTVNYGKAPVSMTDPLSGLLQQWSRGGKWREGCPMWHMEKAFSVFGDFQSWWEKNGYNVISYLRKHFIKGGKWKYLLTVKRQDTSALTVRGMKYEIPIRPDEEPEYGLRECLEVRCAKIDFADYFNNVNGVLVLKNQNLRNKFEEVLARSLPDEADRRDLQLMVGQQILKTGRDYTKPWLISEGGGGKSFFLEHLSLLPGLFEQRSGAITFGKTGYNAAGNLYNVRSRCIVCDEMETKRSKFDEQKLKDVLNGGAIEEIVKGAGIKSYQADFGAIFASNLIPAFQARKACLDRIRIFKFATVSEKIRRETKAKHLFENKAYIAGFCAWIFDAIAMVQQGEEPRVQTMAEKERLAAEFGESVGFTDTTDYACPPELINMAEAMKEGEFVAQADLSAFMNVSAAQKSSWLAINKRGVAAKTLFVRSMRNGIVGYKRTANPIPLDIAPDDKPEESKEQDMALNEIQQAWRVYLAHSGTEIITARGYDPQNLDIDFANELLADFCKTIGREYDYQMISGMLNFAALNALQAQNGRISIDDLGDAKFIERKR